MMTQCVIIENGMDFQTNIALGVINFVPGDPAMISDVIFSHPEFSGLHFTGSTAVFQDIWKKIGNNITKYRQYPRIVGT